MRRLLLLLAASLALLAVAATASAGSVVTETIVSKNVTASFLEDDPCWGPTWITLTFNEVVHVTTAVSGPNTGTSHFTITQAGGSILDPVDPAFPTFAGPFALWGGFNGNRQNAAGTFTLESAVKSEDGTHARLNMVEHFNVSASGIVREFSHVTHDCGD